MTERVGTSKDIAADPYTVFGSDEGKLETWLSSWRKMDLFEPSF